VTLAEPRFSVPVPIVEAPSLNVTVPVAPCGETVAVNVTDWLAGAGLEDDVSVVVVCARFTVWVSGVDALGISAASPL
jgi:hypothetical protein